MIEIIYADINHIKAPFQTNPTSSVSVVIVKINTVKMPKAHFQLNFSKIRGLAEDNNSQEHFLKCFSSNNKHPAQILNSLGRKQLHT